MIDDIPISVGIFDVVAFIDLNFCWDEFLEKVIEILIASSDHSIHRILHLQPNIRQKPPQLPELIALSVSLHSLQHVLEVGHHDVLETGDENILNLIEDLMGGRFLDVFVVVDFHNVLVLKIENFEFFDAIAFFGDIVHRRNHLFPDQKRGETKLLEDLSEIMFDSVSRQGNEAKFGHFFGFEFGLENQIMRNKLLIISGQMRIKNDFIHRSLIVIIHGVNIWSEVLLSHFLSVFD